MSGRADARPLPRLPEDSKVAVLATSFHHEIVDRLVQGAVETLREAGAEHQLVRVPGAWELPLIAADLAERGEHQALIALGCVVRGDTRHYEHVADECARGLMRVQLDHRIPVANGVLAVERRVDALARAGGSAGNKGEDVARAALEMLALRAQMQSRGSQ